MNKQLKKQFEYSDRILDIIDCQLQNDQNSMTRSDLQGCIDAIVMRIMREAEKPEVDEDILNKQWGLIWTGVTEMVNDGSKEAVLKFMQRMVQLGVVK